ncbi:hypothetical protein TNCV_1383961 [Trichonephila clavipes]|nr:hypothetical protein TNCV_1383961 [Trichonephila clavipes]
MKSALIAPANGRTYGSRISSRYLSPIRVPPWNTVRSLCKPGFHYLDNFVFQQCEIAGFWGIVPSISSDDMNRSPV